MMIDLLLDLGGRKVLVTGAAGGIGRATARLLSQRRATLVLADIHPPNVTRERLGALTGKAEIIQLDCSDRQAIEDCVRTYGPFTDLVDAAAIYGGDNWTEAGWDEAFEQGFCRKFCWNLSTGIART
jgi:NAD(P)-dependent dehydrogenase (short-subunit alcohol dehydrogenase family)